MASPSLIRSSQCLLCAKRVSGGLENALRWGQQVRGLKKDVGKATTRVVLLQDITRYGSKGSIVKVPTGTMRNLWWPKKMAEYLTREKCEELGVKKDAAVERDSTFPSRKQRKIAKKEQVAALEEQTRQQAKAEERKEYQTTLDLLKKPGSAATLEVDQLSIEESTALLDKLLPRKVEFYRTVVPTPELEDRISPSVPRSSTVSAAARAGKAPVPVAKTNIYGSVSTSDIATNLKAVLAEDTRGVRILFNAEQISFVEETEEKDRVKHLGEFNIEIRLKGASESVRRKIQIRAQG